ncbi:hypothetical protein FQA39_LY08834 [Lamprigera yunnana]|nr:hypothetical protein FQA39_LY08834 [Lamprigera yunnana]
MLSSLRSKSTNCEYDTKFIHDRIQHTEKRIAELCNAFAHYSRKVSKIRDQGDVLSETLITYADNEEINKSLSLGLTNFANSFTVLNNYGDARVKYIDKKIVGEFCKYETICKQVKEDLKQMLTIQEKEFAKKKQFKRMRERKLLNRQMMQQAEVDLAQSHKDVTEIILNVEDKLNTFEKQKLHDVKSILLDFIALEMSYHARALEQLTKAFNNVLEIDEEFDLNTFGQIIAAKGVEFKNALSIVNSPLRMSHPAINTMDNRISLRNSPGIPTLPLRQCKSEETLDISDSKSESEEESSIDTEIVSPIIAKKVPKAT